MGVSIEATVMVLGGEGREFTFSPRAMRLAQKLLGGKNPRMLLVERGEDVIITCAACGLIKQMGDKADVERVQKWLDREPEKYPELERCVLEAALRYYRAIGLVQGDDEGEEKGAP